MALPDLLRQLRDRYDGFNPPATAADLARLQSTLGPLPDEVLALYRDHDGSPAAPLRDGAWLPTRLLPTNEALDITQTLRSFDNPSLGDVAWLWTDDNSNYAGVYTTGPAAGFVVIFAHDEPSLAPAYRSVAAFLQHLIDSAPKPAADGSEDDFDNDAAIDIPTIPRQLPVTEDDPAHRESDRALARALLDSYERETDPDRRRLYAQSAVALTPVADTASVTPLLFDPDMWTPEAPVALFELRNHTAATPDLERLARAGQANGDSAALRLLAKWNTPESRAALARLRQHPSPDKRKLVEQIVRMWSPEP
jgi:hypothetical protein